MLPTSVAERNELAFLDAISAEYHKCHGAAPFNLSHWDPGHHAIRSLESCLTIPEIRDIMPYVYSDELDLRDSIRQRLGLFGRDRDCQIVPTGTSAMLAAILWLKAAGVNRLAILCPSYFPVFYVCQLLGLPFTSVYMNRDRDGWKLPCEELQGGLLTGERVAVWITNPVYCTGVHLSSSGTDFIQRLLNRGVYVVLDECLCLSGREIGPRVESTDRFVGLYSPHKSVAVNAIKFAAVVHASVHTRLFRHWSDVVIGGLSASTKAAVLHYLSDNFEVYERAFLEYIAEAKTRIQSVQGATASSIELDSDAEGYFISCYAKNIAAEDATPTFLRDLVFGTGGSVIPGLRNHFGSSIPFNFRLNLARACPQFFGTFGRVSSYLSRIYAMK